MKLYWINTHWIIKKLFSGFIWHKTNTKNTVYLTFDDGPIPEVTLWVLEKLKEYNAKATFFCIGDNIDKNPAVFKKIEDDGHGIGNHTYNHLNGWKTKNKTYLDNIKKCEEKLQHSLKKKNNLQSKLFRPPYGKLKIAQSRAIRQLGYKIIMWDILSADFDPSIPKEKCLENVLTNIKSGSIIVFHDSIKASKNLEYALPKTLEYLKQNNFTCGIL